MVITSEDGLVLLEGPPEPRVAFSAELIEQSDRIQREDTVLMVRLSDVTLVYRIVTDTPDALDCTLIGTAGSFGA